MNVLEQIKKAGENGKVFTVCFVKKNGEERAMNCRLGVVKHLKGGDSTTAHLNYLITVFDMKKKAYRNINLTTVKWVKTGGQEIKVS